MERELLTTQDKALRINLEPMRYGTFAEIGAGQEVVRWFFNVGGASGTIAKSISAYDMQVSDAIYGKCARYVCRERLESMLQYEHNLNIERLRHERGEQTAFFAFANTVATSGYKSTQEGHGWMGVKYQVHPGDEDSQILIHVRMTDRNSTRQQEALGIVGVNLLYGACFLHHRPEELIESLSDNLSAQRIQVDMIEFSGIEFRNVDNRLMSLKLVQTGLSDAAMFSAQGKTLQPSEAIYKRPLLIERGSFHPVRKVHLDLMNTAWAEFQKEVKDSPRPALQIMEVTMHQLEASGGLEPRAFLNRADALMACGYDVLISNYFEYYRLAAYLTRLSGQKLGLAMGIKSLQSLFNEQFYTQLEGGILESLGRLFKKDLKLYIYPTRDPVSGEVEHLGNVNIADSQRKLFEYLVDKGDILPLHHYNPECLEEYGKDLLHDIRNNNPRWEKAVPEPVVKLIRDKQLFGFRDS